MLQRALLTVYHHYLDAVVFLLLSRWDEKLAAAQGLSKILKVYLNYLEPFASCCNMFLPSYK